MFGQRPKRIGAVLIEFLRVVWVDSRGCEQLLWKRFRELQSTNALRDRRSGHDEPIDAGGLRSFEHFSPIAVEAVVSEVCTNIDQSSHARGL